MDNTLVQRMLTTIETEYAGVLTLRTLSRAIGRQPAYLGRVFRQEVGSTVRDYVTRVRLNRATELIRDGVKIEAVALSVGYRSKKNFYQQFKRQYGTTPLPYRTSARRAAPVGGQDHGFTTHPEPSPQALARRPIDRPDQANESTRSDPEPEPVAGRLGSIIRASNRAWRLAIKTQGIMLAHFAQTRIALLLTDDAGRYVGANPAAGNVTGFSVPELRRLAPADLFEAAPTADTRCVWQLVFASLRTAAQPNAVIRKKHGDSYQVYMVTLKNMLWGRREMSALIEELSLRSA